MNAWNRLRLQLKRRYGLQTYAGVKEEGAEHGMKHLHIVLAFASKPLQSAVRALWHKLTGAYMVNLKVIGTDRTDQYLAKYLAKGAQITRKDMFFAQNWPKLPPLAPPLDVQKFYNPPVPTPARIALPDGTVIEVPWTQCDCLGDEWPAYVHSVLLERSARNRGKP